MSPITHFLAGWTALERTQASHRDRALVAWIGLAPDLDGLGIVIDFFTRAVGLPETNYYQALHRVYGHGLPAAVVFTVLVAAFGQHRWRAAIGAFAAVHLHFICDILGSRGNGPEDYWPIWYLAPFSTAVTLEWDGQWPLVGWQNMVITAALMVVAAAMALRHGYSPVHAFSKRGDAAFMQVLRKRAGRGGA